ncbi:uncharacterized protein [Aegilops tauschii subsp. strangulata]|uniref:uncharacterized protein isoform X2 n=1 Tax=Aegilops tauschii subsp. strangulata TaxID=200361 RepID=UPI00098A84FF|nr:uncharacterized protein LOC109763623 isoform X2 [Aegilops tauschii subsp. strangulata]
MAHGAAASGGAASASAAARASRGAPGTWRRVRRAAREAAAHALLLCFTTLLALKLDGVFVSRSWWVFFIPLWLFHAAVVRYRFSLPAPLLLQNYQVCPLALLQIHSSILKLKCLAASKLDYSTLQRIPCHSIVATPLLVAFELLLCIYLEGQGEPFLDLKLVFLPLLALEIITLVDNFRMFGALMPGHGETITDEEIWDRLPHFWVAISMVFLLAATSLMLLKLCGDAVTLGWWDLFINFGISQCFAFLVCIRWSNPMDIGGPVLIIPIVISQVLLCMRLEGTPSYARFIPVRAIFSPILLLQVVAVLFAIWRFFERLVIKLQDGIVSEGYISVSSKINELFMMVQYGSRLITWSIDEDSKEEQAHLCYTNNIGYSTFCSYPPEMVKEMPKKVLVKEIQRLQVALGEQSKMAMLSQQQCERLKNERILCRICFERDICIVLLPCRHHVLCEPCSDKCQSCPICRVPIESKSSVNDAVNSDDPLSDIV